MLRYKKGYKYRIVKDFSVRLIKFGLIVSKKIDTKYYSVIDSVLTIKEGYSWDGASGGMVDTKGVMIPALVHDCFYEMIRKGHLSSDMRVEADKIFLKLMKERGVNLIRRNIAYRAVRLFGKGSIKPRKIYTVK